MAELQSELNRLAGTTGLDVQGAAQVWSGTTLDLVGALNAKAGNTAGAGNRRDLQGVLNQLAGTTGLGVNGAASLIGVAPGPAASLVLSPESTLFQDSTRLTPATADGDPIGSWSDTVGGLHGASATTKRPVLKRNVLNDYDVVRFDGTDDTIVGSMATLTAQTWFLVARKNSAVAAALKTLLGIALNDTTKAILFTSTTYGPGYSYGVNQAGGFTSVAGTPTGWNVVALSYASTSSANVRIGGGAGTVLDPNDTFPTYNTYTLAANFLSSYGDFDIAEVRRYSSDLSLANLDIVGNYLASKYALTWTAAS